MIELVVDNTTETVREWLEQEQATDGAKELFLKVNELFEGRDGVEVIEVLMLMMRLSLTLVRDNEAHLLADCYIDVLEEFQL